MFAGLPLDTIALAAFLAFCRVGACFMLMPGLSSARIAMHVRLFVSLSVTWALLAHLWDAILPVASRSTEMLLLAVAGELLIGATIGIMTRIYMLALQFAGSAIAMTGGYGGMAGSAVEEQDAQAAVTAIITLSALLVLFALDFHHEIIKALITSYAVAPPGELFNPQGALIDLTDTVAESFYLTLRLTSPFIAYAVLVNLAIGFVNKLAPQIPVFFISMPFVLFGSLVLMYFGIGTMLALFGDGFVPTTIGR